jgi:hypothetical protein
MTAVQGQTKVMDVQEAEQILQGVHGASRKGLEDGTRIHIHYTAFGTPDSEAIRLAQRAADLGLPRDRYTGRVSKVWRSKGNDLLVTVWVELERDHLYRTLNLSRGTVHNIVVLGN